MARNDPFNPEFEPFLSKVFNILETLNNLHYLAKQECDNQDKVILYMDMADERLRALSALLMTGNWEQ